MGFIDWLGATSKRVLTAAMQHKLVLLLACTTAGSLLALAYMHAARGEAWPGAGGMAGQREGAQTTEARLEALERRQAEQFEALNRQLALLSRGGGVAPSPERERTRQARREHQRRMREDPAYELKVLQDRLADLQSKYAAEPVDQRWSAEARTLVDDALGSAVSRAGAKLSREQTDCRGQTCRIQLDVPLSSSYEDIATYLMSDLAELLPNAQFVVMPPRDGIRTVNIFARRSSGARTVAGDG